MGRSFKPTTMRGFNTPSISFSPVAIKEAEKDLFPRVRRLRLGVRKRQKATGSWAGVMVEFRQGSIVFRALS